MDENNDLLKVLAAMVTGDRWLSADSCAVYLGMFTASGKPNRRGFIERVACLPGFPQPNPITKSWPKSQVEAWAFENQRKVSREPPAPYFSGGRQVNLSAVRVRPYKPRKASAE